MAITVSNPNNITSPIGNALAIFKDSSTNNFFVVDKMVSHAQHT